MVIVIVIIIVIGRLNNNANSIQLKRNNIIRLLVHNKIYIKQQQQQ